MRKSTCIWCLNKIGIGEFKAKRDNLGSFCEVLDTSVL